MFEGQWRDERTEPPAHATQPGTRMLMLADQIACVAVVSHDPAAAASVFERHFRQRPD